MPQREVGPFPSEAYADGFAAGIAFANDSALAAVGPAYEEPPASGRWFVPVEDDDYCPDAADAADDPNPPESP